MDHTQIEAGVTELEQEIGELKDEVEVLKQTLRMYRTQLRAGEDVKPGEIAGSVAQVSKLVLMTREAEKKIAERKKEKCGVAYHYAVDMERARNEIGCRLDRLRARGCPRRVYEEPDRE